MKRNIKAEPGFRETRLSHMAFGLRENKFVGIIDAEDWFSKEHRRRKSALHHQQEVIIA